MWSKFGPMDEYLGKDLLDYILYLRPISQNTPSLTQEGRLVAIYDNAKEVGLSHGTTKNLLVR